MSSELSYLEFQSIRRRRARDREDVAVKEEEEVVAPEKKAVRKDLNRVGAVLEMEEVQSVVCLLILAEVLLTSLREVTWLSKLATTFRGFAAFAFFFELIALAAGFGRDFWSHPGYLCDLCVVVFTLQCEIRGTTSAWASLSLLRLWRLYRLHESAVRRHEHAAKKAQATLDAEREEALKSKVALASLKGILDEAKAAKKRLETMCKTYKDEIDTLNEALAIAAMDVAENADDELTDELQIIPTRATKEKRTTATFVVDKKGTFSHHQSSSSPEDKNKVVPLPTKPKEEKETTT